MTNFRGGFRPAIIPAGYVGVAFWGGVFVALSGSRIGATIAAGIFMTALLICLKYVGLVATVSAGGAVFGMTFLTTYPLALLLFKDTLPMAC